MKHSFRSVGPVCALWWKIYGRVSCGRHRLAERANWPHARRRTALHMRTRGAHARDVGQQAASTRRPRAPACG